MLENETRTPLPKLVGLTLRHVVKTQLDGDDALLLLGNDGTGFVMHHKQNCCENVWLEDCEDLEGWYLQAEILEAEVVCGEISSDSVCEEGYTVYKIRTDKGYHTITWRGTSNGYYSTTVEITPLVHDVNGVFGEVILAKGYALKHCELLETGEFK